MIAPTLTDTDITLRHHVMADLDAFWAFYQSPRAEHVDAPSNKSHCWYGFSSEVGSWSLTGVGGWAIDADGVLAGQVAIIHPPHFPEMEIGWILFDGFERRNIAYRGARLALDWFWDNRPEDTLVSYIDRNNARSITLAKRLGAAADPSAEKYDDVDVVYRHRRPQ